VNETEAVVVGVEGDDIWLRSLVHQCETCADAGSCGIGKRPPPLQRLPNTVGARPGDVVIVTVASGAVLRAATLAYLLPLVLALIAAALGLRLGGDAAALGGLVGGLLVGWLVARRWGRRQGGGEPLLTVSIKPIVPSLHRKPQP
jgi:sigma-E factor negative regulatory protein RseC